MDPLIDSARAIANAPGESSRLGRWMFVAGIAFTIFSGLILIPILIVDYTSAGFINGPTEIMGGVFLFCCSITYIGKAASHGKDQRIAGAVLCTFGLAALALQLWMLASGNYSDGNFVYSLRGMPYTAFGSIVCVLAGARMFYWRKKK